MLKGVSHKIIEVNHTDSPYFERAVLYLRPGTEDLPVRAALCESERYLENRGIARRMRRRFWRYLAGLAAFGAGCGAAVLLGMAHFNA